MQCVNTFLSWFTKLFLDSCIYVKPDTVTRDKDDIITGSTVAKWLIKKGPGLSPGPGSGAFLCKVCMFSPSLGGFTLPPPYILTKVLAKDLEMGVAVRSPIVPAGCPSGTEELDKCSFTDH